MAPKKKASTRKLVRPDAHQAVKLWNAVREFESVLSELGHGDASTVLSALYLAVGDGDPELPCALVSALDPFQGKAKPGPGRPRTPGAEALSNVMRTIEGDANPPAEVKRGRDGLSARERAMLKEMGITDKRRYLALRKQRDETRGPRPEWKRDDERTVIVAIWAWVDSLGVPEKAAGATRRAFVASVLADAKTMGKLVNEAAARDAEKLALAVHRALGYPKTRSLTASKHTKAARDRAAKRKSRATSK